MQVEHYRLRGCDAYNVDDDHAILIARDGTPQIVSFEAIDRDGAFVDDVELPAELCDVWTQHRQRIEQVRDRDARERFTLRDANDRPFKSAEPGVFGGNSESMIFGMLDCGAALDALPGYARKRVFFADESTARAAGYRPCGWCMRRAYIKWKRSA